MAHRIKHKVESTMDRLVDYAATVGVSGTVTGLSCSLIFATDMHCTVSGTSPGVVTLAMPKDLSYPRLVAWGADIIAGSTSSLNSGGPNGSPTAVRQRYFLEKRAFQYEYGSQVVSSSTGLYANPRTSTNPAAAGYDGGAVFQFGISALQVMVTGNVAAGNITTVSGTAVDPIDASVAAGSPTANITVWAKFRDTTRGR